MKTIDVKNKWGVIKATIMVDDEDYDKVSKLKLYAQAKGITVTIKAKIVGSKPLVLTKVLNPDCKRSYFKNGNSLDFTRSNISFRSLPHIRKPSRCAFHVRKCKYGFVGEIKLTTPTFKTHEEYSKYILQADRVVKKAREGLRALHINYASSPSENPDDRR